jgi:hypothetical protein
MRRKRSSGRSPVAELQANRLDQCGPGRGAVHRDEPARYRSHTTSAPLRSTLSSASLPGPASQCTGCHQDRNLVQARVPGAPGWHLVPREMAWMGKSPHQICEQVKDPKRNGGKSLAQIVEHNAHDKALVAWGGPRAVTVSPRQVRRSN